MSFEKQEEFDTEVKGLQKDVPVQETSKWEEEYRWKKAQKKIMKAQKNLKRVEEELKREEEELKKAKEDLILGFKTISVRFEDKIFPIRIRTRWTVLCVTAFIVNAIIHEESSNAEQITLVSIRPEHNSYYLLGYRETEMFMDEFKLNDDENDYIYLEQYRYQYILEKTVGTVYGAILTTGGYLGNFLYSGYQDLQNVVTPEKRKKLE